VLTPTRARRPRAILSGLALAAFAVAATPLASPAAAPRASAKQPVHAVKTTPKRSSGYHPHTGLAPADEYFGRLGMSVLGVRNKVKDLGLDADTHPEHDRAVLGGALWVEDAMRDWAKKYPLDRWLPRYAYALEEVYERMPGDVAHRRAVKQVAYITAYFPHTLYARVGRAKLAAGVPTPNPGAEQPLAQTELERLARLDGKALPTMPPAPGPAATPAPTAEPAATQTPATATAPSPAAAASAQP
jgi:hypothetical protein